METLQQKKLGSFKRAMFSYVAEVTLIFVYRDAKDAAAVTNKTLSSQSQSMCKSFCLLHTSLLSLSLSLFILLSHTQRPRQVSDY